MSWHFSGVGKPDALKRAIDTEVQGYGDPATSQSRREYDEAAPALKTLIGAAPAGAVVSDTASVHASFDDHANRNGGGINVDIKTIGMLRE